MVCSGISGLTRTGDQMFRNMKILLPMGPPDAIPTNHEIDFSVVFGPIPVKPSVEVNGMTSNNIVPQRASDGKNYDSPAVLRNQSHAPVGPSHITQLLQHASLETNSLRDLGVCSTVETEFQHEKTCSNDAVEKDNQTKEVSGVRLEDFEVLKLVGRGAFGKAFQVRKMGTSEIFAMKVMGNDKIIEKNHATYMKAERDILTKIDHRFVVLLRYSFQTKYRLYLVLDFVNWVHLFFQLYHQGLFREDLTRIYAAEIVSVVSHLHADGIMHRDLKPENILMDTDGQVMLTDFGLAKEFNGNDRSNSLCGTVEYMAPEIINGKGHDKAADWWSVGILLFEMLTGQR